MVLYVVGFGLVTFLTNEYGCDLIIIEASLLNSFLLFLLFPIANAFVQENNTIRIIIFIIVFIIIELVR